jgi:hypothetical protein
MQSEPARPPREDGPLLTDFSDTLRLVAMAGVVTVHCYLPIEPREADAWYNQAGRFADALFLTVSAYLWELQRGSSRPSRYLARRLSSLYLPYLFWVSATAVFVVGWFVISPNLEATPLGVVRFVFTSTAFWFIPQLLLSLWFAALVWRHTNPGLSGLVLVGITVMYGINVAVDGVPIRHTEAPLGFVGFAWFGFMLHRHERCIRDGLVRVPVPAWVAAVVLAYLAAGFETTQLGREDTLRLTTTVYGLTVTAALLAAGYRLGRKASPRFRGFAYGVYLTHTFLALVIITGLGFLFREPLSASGAPPTIVVMAARIGLFVVVWGASWQLVKQFRRLGAGRLVGEPRRGSQRPPASVAPRA